MKKLVITSSIMYKAHRLTKAMVEESTKTYHFVFKKHLDLFLEEHTEYKEGKKENGFFTAVSYLVSYLDYRTQLGINIRHYMNVEKSNREFKLLQISAYKWIKARINHNNNIHSAEMHDLISDMNIDLNIKRYYWGEPMNAWNLSHDLAIKHSKNIKRYA